ncbi:hypothetical protein AB0M54_09235 [Actinoplanes sp. NPDC051470]|uniref:hypothetical protein n=1 Tax=unclassified Actinoplanes TaxID=2626549 RepID=UPI0034294714
MIPRQRRPSAEPEFPPGDPRSRTDGLGWVARAVFPDPMLRLTVGDQGPPAVRYAVLPSLDDAKFLLPLASRRVTAASVLAYNALRPPRVRATRAVVGGLARAGLLGLTRAPILTVTGGPLLWEHLADLLGTPRLHAAIGIRPPDPHHKPTLQLFDDQGRARGYAKIGWNAGTRAMVRDEAATLASLPPPAADFPEAPGLLLHTQWQQREIAVIAPMPRQVRGVRRPASPRTAAMLAVARVAGPRAPFASSSFLAGWRRRASGAGLAAAESPGAITVDDAIEALVARDGDLDLAFGHWHGDWVPWNMGRHDGRLLLWDWENSAPDVPLGFDLAHQFFQMALSGGAATGPSAAAMDDALREHGRELGLDERRQRFVGDAYLIELWLRAYQLSGGAGWNRRLHPALLDTLAGRLA